MIPRLLLTCSLLFAGCFRVDNPPQVTLVGLDKGLLPDPSAPLVLSFSEPAAVGSLRARVIRYQVDLEGNLYDEDANPDSDLDLLFDSSDDTGGSGSFDATRQSFRVVLTKPLPIGVQLAVLIDPGLADEQGNRWNVRQILKFGYQCNKGHATMFPKAGKYFWLITVDKPLPGQIQLFSDMRVTSETGQAIGQFTNAERNPAIHCGQFSLTCSETQRCRTLPQPACVDPSMKAGTVDEYVDFIADATSEIGYTFTIRGFISDQPDGSYCFANEPATVVTKKPAVTVEGIALSASWKYDAGKVLRGTGTFGADRVSLGAPPNTTPSGSGVGTHVERQIPDDKAPPIPPPPAQ